MKKLITVKGDVTNPQPLTDEEVMFIPHCCNTDGVMGAGVALALRKKWPQIFDDYIELLKSNICGEFALGNNALSHVESNIIVVNMIGQLGTVSVDNYKPIRYVSIMKCMEDIAHLIKDRQPRHSNVNFAIHTPKFGSDLAGGNWDFILELIRECWLERNIDVVVYEFE